MPTATSGSLFNNSDVQNGENVWYRAQQSGALRVGRVDSVTSTGVQSILVPDELDAVSNLPLVEFNPAGGNMVYDGTATDPNTLAVGSWMVWTPTSAAEALAAHMTATSVTVGTTETTIVTATFTVVNQPMTVDLRAKLGWSTSASLTMTYRFKVDGTEVDKVTESVALASTGEAVLEPDMMTLAVGSHTITVTGQTSLSTATVTDCKGKAIYLGDA